MPQPTPPPTLTTGIQFVAMGLVWGASFLFMKVALEGVSFGQVAWSRLLLGALTLGVIVLVRRLPIPRSPRLLAHFLVIGVTGGVVPFLLYAWAEQYVTSGLASIYNATTPIATALMVTLVFRVEKLSRAQLLGILVGIVGVVLIIGPWRFTGIVSTPAAGASPVIELAGQLACLGAALSYGVTFSYLRKFITPYGISGVMSAFLQIGMGGIVMLILTPFVALGEVRLDAPIVASLLVLGALGTGVAYLWNMNVLASWGPTAASTVTYITPVVGVTLGVLVLGERLGWNEPVGAVIVLLGILLAQGRIRLKATRA